MATSATSACPVVINDPSVSGAEVDPLPEDSGRYLFDETQSHGQQLVFSHGLK
jgi:hypothetical protein